MEIKRFCVCGRSDSQGYPQGVDELWEELRDVVERKRELARECALDPRLLRDMRALREQEMELRVLLERSSWENSEKT